MQWQIDIDTGVLTLDGRPVATLNTGSGSIEDWREATRLGTEMAHALNARSLLPQLRRNNEYLSARVAEQQTRIDNLVRLLSGIHNLLYPPVKLLGGNAYHFRPENPHEFMQALSDRIRALPDELNRI